MSEGPTIGDWTQYGWIPDGASSFPARVRLRNAAWMVYYEPDVTDLKAEVLLLRRENKELRNILAHAVMLADLYEGLTDTRLSLDGGIVDCDWLMARCEKLGVTA